MLVLTRKSGQKIWIGNNIVITVGKIQGDQVSIGIDAPKDLPIAREELLLDDLAKKAAEENKKSVVNKNNKPDLQEAAKKIKNEF